MCMFPQVMLGATMAHHGTPTRSLGTTKSLGIIMMLGTTTMTMG